MIWKRLGKQCTSKSNPAIYNTGNLVCSLTMLSTFAAACQQQLSQSEHCGPLGSCLISCSLKNPLRLHDRSEEALLHTHSKSILLYMLAGVNCAFLSLFLLPCRAGSSEFIHRGFCHLSCSRNLQRSQFAALYLDCFTLQLQQLVATEMPSSVLSQARPSNDLLEVMYKQNGKLLHTSA